MKKVYNTISSLAEHMSYARVMTALVASIAILVGGLLSANTYYELSRYPVRLFAGQLAFSPEKVAEWYQFLVANDTLNIYIKTQYIDFIFIFGLMATIFFTQLLIVKLNTKGSRWYTFAVGMCFWGPLLATADIWENLTTLTMLSNPTGFTPTLAYIASSFTVWKLSWSLIGTTLVVVQLISLSYRKIMNIK
ncbi:hypothetical protein IPN41_03335 [Candidatus Falkowbacteria bacterium]|nr:MAG: hypothetical protein IPN41_03335 [Candidatus Falkowbacteria bacterium]